MSDDQSPLPRLRLKPLRPERYGHPWVYSGEVADGPEPRAADGDWLEIVDHNAKVVGAAYYNSKSKIVARRLPLPKNELGGIIRPGAAWWRAQISAAYDYRRMIGAVRRGFYRLVHADADQLPGLIVDVYGAFVVIQLLSLGMDRRRAEVVAALQAVLRPAGIYERSDVSTRSLEGLQERTGVLSGASPPSRLELKDDLRLLVDITAGAKTGLFLDQIDNQKSAARYAAGRRVLNVFSYTGLFSLRAAAAGAASVEDVDSSAHFQAIAAEQWEINRLAVSATSYAQTTANAFDELRRRQDADYRADMVVLDPPAFTKSRAGATSALRGYNEINRRALRILSAGGILVTCSCSHHLAPAEFEAVVAGAARDAGRRIRLIERRAQPSDHPVVFGIPETEYLKMLILAVD